MALGTGVAEFAGLRFLINQMQGFEIEVECYRPGNTFFKDHGLPAPQGFYAAFDPDHGRYMILMEDLGVVPLIKPGDQVYPEKDLSLGVCLAVFEEITKMHTRYWCVRQRSVAGVVRFQESNEAAAPALC